MPFVNGLGFLYRLRANAAHAHVPVAIITGDSCIDDPVLEEMHDLGAELVFKPLWDRRSRQRHARPARETPRVGRG